MWPVRASTNVSGAQPSRSLPSAASLCACISPAIIAFNMRRPLAPKMSVITEQSLTLAFFQNRLNWHHSRHSFVQAPSSHALHLPGSVQNARRECARPASNRRRSLPSLHAYIAQLSSHSASSSSPCVVVGNRRTSRSTFPSVTRRRQTATSVLCTSTPAHLLCNVFIATSSKCGRREALAV